MSLQVRLRRDLVLAWFALVVAPLVAAAAPPSAHWTTRQFNPQIGASATVVVSLDSKNRVTATVVDVHGKHIRTLSKSRSFPAGAHELVWDGRDESGEPVPNGAYILEMKTKAHASKIESARLRAGTPIEVPVRYFDRQQGIIAYEAPSASLVTIVASALSEGKRMSTVVVADAARPAGAIVEPWSGFDENGVTHIASLPGFAIAISTRALPAETIILYGGERGADAVTDAPTGRESARKTDETKHR